MIFIRYFQRVGIILTFLVAYWLLLVMNAIGINVWLPSCPVKSTFGVECLGCGLNHAAIALFQGDLKNAFEYNWLIFVYIPVILGLFTYDLINYYTNYKKSTL